MVIDFERDNYKDLVAKIVLTGDPSVGKTSLRKRYLGKGFDTSYLPTMGADFAIKKINIKDEVTIHTQIWDLAGQRNYYPLLKHYLRNISGALLVFDLSRYETYSKLSFWIEEIYKTIRFPFQNIPILIIGNKADLDEREVVESDIHKYVEHLNERQANLFYIETSAKTGYNVPIAFEKIAHQIAIAYEEKYQNK